MDWKSHDHRQHRSYNLSCAYCRRNGRTVLLLDVHIDRRLEYEQKLRHASGIFSHCSLAICTLYCNGIHTHFVFYKLV